MSDSTSQSPGWSATRYQRLLACAYFLVLAVWSVGIAFNGAPDESTHFFLLEYLKAFHSIPVAAEPIQAFTGPISGHTWQPGDFWYHGLPFPHVVGALITSYGFSWALPSDMAYLAARSFNWLLGAVFICALFRIAYRSGMREKHAAIAALVICLIPQVSFVFSYFNSDAWGLTSIALLLSALMGFLKEPKKYTAICFGGALGLVLMAKLYFLPALVFAAVMICATHFFGRKNFTKHLSTSLAIAIVIAGPMLILTYAKFGEVTGISGQLAFVAMHRSNPAAGFGTCYLGCNGHLVEMSNALPWLTLTLKSYFSVTGWMNIFLPDRYYVIAALALAVLILGAIRKGISSYSRSRTTDVLLTRILPLILIIGLFPSIVILSLLASQSSLPQPQGRYLFVTIPFLVILIALAKGYSPHRDSVSKSEISSSASDRYFPRFLIVITAWMTWTNVMAWSINTSSPTNVTGSALGQAMSDAVHTADMSKGSAHPTLSVEELVNRMSLVDGEFRLKVTVAPQDAVGHLDTFVRTERGWHLEGWSSIPQAHGSPQYVIGVEDGKIMGAIMIQINRPDVAKALNSNAALRSGYSGEIPTNSPAGQCNLQLYTVSSSFEMFSMPGACDSISRSSN